MLKKSFLLVIVWALWLSITVQAQQLTKPVALTANSNSAANPAVETFQLDSKLMKRKMPYAVIFPSSYERYKTRRYPTVYSLHGLTGHYNDWMRSDDFVNYISNKHEFVVVLVEGENGWYVNSAVNPNEKYESYIIEELIPEVDKNFRTVADKRTRAVVGLSMGGYGSLKFGLKYPEKFAFVGSMSGALGAASYSSSLITSGWGLLKTSLETAFGAADTDTRKNNDIFGLVRILTPEQKNQLPFIYLDCGTEDFLIGNNRDFAKLLLEKKVRHEFRQLPGAHNWEYWNKQGVEILRELDRTFPQSFAPTMPLTTFLK